MTNPLVTSLHFQRKMADFCDLRIAPLTDRRTVENIKSWFDTLITHHRSPPMRKAYVDWAAVVEICGIEENLSEELRRNLRSGLDAITRWAKSARPNDDVRPSPIADAEPLKGRPKRSDRPRCNVSAVPKPAQNDENRTRPGPEPKPVEEFPQPLFDCEEDPASFDQALTYHMRRHGDTYWHLHRAVAGDHDTFDNKTILSWMTGNRVPQSLDSFEVLKRIEHRYRLPEEYFRAKLPHQARAASGHHLGADVTRDEQRRLAWHLPDEFNSLPFTKREEILEWVRRVIVSGSTDYRRYQAMATRQRYAIRFPSISYGGSLSPRMGSEMLLHNEEAAPGRIEDPDLLSGVVDAPPRLAMEMTKLIRFKTTTLTALGFQRNGVWGEETASQKIEHLGLMFGALAASTNGEVKGYGVALSQLTFGLLVFPGVWDWYLQWRERRRGFYTQWEEDMLSILLGLLRPETGWLWQHPELARQITPIPGLISPEEVEMARDDWRAACDTCFKHASHRSKEIQRVMRVHRDPFEPIMCVLEAESPLAVDCH